MRTALVVTGLAVLALAFAEIDLGPLKALARAVLDAVPPDDFGLSIGG